MHGRHPHALGIVDGLEILRTTPFVTAKGATVVRTTTLATGRASYIYTPLDTAPRRWETTPSPMSSRTRGADLAPATVTITVEDLAVERAEYRPRTGRWQVSGTSSDPLANSVTLYGCPCAALSGDAEVPLVITDAAGSATLLIDDDSIELQISIDPLPASAITAIRIHVDDPAANNPFIFIPFSTNQGVFTGTLTRTLTSLNLAQRPEAGIASMEDAAQAIRAGNTYIKVITVANPGGEIRGAIIRPAIGTAPVAADGHWEFSGKSTVSPGAPGFVDATSANGVLSTRMPLRLR